MYHLGRGENFREMLPWRNTEPQEVARGRGSEEVRGF